jgi:hypothetical protein
MAATAALLRRWPGHLGVLRARSVIVAILEPNVRISRTFSPGRNKKTTNIGIFSSHARNDFE